MPIAAEAWLRADSSELADEELYACDAQWPGRYDRMFGAFTTGCFRTRQKKLNGAWLLRLFTAKVRRNKRHLTPALPPFSRIHLFRLSATFSQSEAERNFLRSLRSFAAN